MSHTPHIVVVGLGGVGGYFGGLWTRLAMQQPDRLRVSYLMRPGQHYEAVRQHGLTISSPRIEPEIVHPQLVTCDPAELGEIDYLVLVTKSYDLRESLTPLLPDLTERTHVIPLLNGLDLHDTLREMLPPHVHRWAGVAFITSRRTAPGVITSYSTNERLFVGDVERPIGSLRTDAERLFVSLSQDAGIDLINADDPMIEVRKKYLMLSNSAAATGYFDCNVEGLLTTHRPFVVGLTEELVALYRAKGWEPEPDAVAASLRRIERMPPSTTTSMNSDLRAHHQSEVESLVGYVVRESMQLGLPTPHYTEAYQGILQRIHHDRPSA